jgi:hypothetical protein
VKAETVRPRRRRDAVNNRNDWLTFRGPFGLIVRYTVNG